jgi:hypothetical protein
MNKEKYLSYEIDFNRILENEDLNQLFLEFLKNNIKNESKKFKVNLRYNE